MYSIAPAYMKENTYITHGGTEGKSNQQQLDKYKDLIEELVQEGANISSNFQVHLKNCTQSQISNKTAY